MTFDVLVVGGSFAGLSAAMQLARARRPVCVVDAGAPRNRFAEASHGFFAQDGVPPFELLEQARGKLRAYPSVTFVDAFATSARADGGGFVLGLDGHAPLRARKLVLAHGVRDVLPEIGGLAERWGRTVLHCPYCHGYEVAGRTLGVLSTSPMSAHHAALVADWGPVTLLLDGPDTLSDEDRALLRRRNVAVATGRVVALEGDAPALTAAVLDNGRRVPLEALFIGPRTVPASPLADQLGCAFDEGMAGSAIRVDEMKQTTVPGVFAAGDAARGMHNATFASADGVMAGVAAHRSLVFDL
ncbi:NAD(P)/FAD-dependent oxidoreductase [Piscinibacter gummiphilus]|uniref:Thioredoxin reductase n=1 Tax=Piscinibacter gummiphilus TaxID=946333 RepID=A0A1W6LCD3_9BURK|nr:NAD(P)/FAD-dependent oxidoreductase [Piscinibacter gummiphilus]ARN21906.1 thioredoxin reductase [Piscinibacter gummiphilus]ATU66592.1 NAD(P)/FAD-dependent oxidoreductase [Piscinibacter gummiphilus]GLS93965.1 thioredoxin reductase [Piscinibacter gummiphilus]